MDRNITRAGRVHRVGTMPTRTSPVLTPAGVQARSALTDALRGGQAVRELDDNADADKPAPNDEGKPKTPSDVDPSMPSPDSVVPENRDEEETDAEELNTKVKAGGVMNWFDELGS